ncbi:MAG: hypothetical protein R3F54_13690 [Alphaproteobacteria bacterium]
MVCSKGIGSDQNGAAAAHYALMSGLVSLVVLAGSLALREPIIALYDVMADQANGALAVEPTAVPATE